MEKVVATNINPTFWGGRRVLVTGHTGFKGGWLTLWLQQLGAEVFGMALEPEYVPTPGHSLFHSLDLAERMQQRNCIGDIRSANSVQAVVDSAQPDVVFHLAAQSLVRESYIDPVGT